MKPHNSVEKELSGRFRAKMRICNILLIVCLILTNVSTANAMLSEAANLAMMAAGGMMQEDDKKLEQAILQELNDSEKQKLREYVEKTRPIIKEERQFFGDYMKPAFGFLTAHVPAGNMLMGGINKLYIMRYESKLKDGTDSTVLKKFAELREHNIDAGQGMFEAYMDFIDSSLDRDNSGLGLIVDATLLAVKGEQYNNRYKSSAAAIATVLEAAGIPMQPEDIGDICSGHNEKETQNKDNVNTPSNNKNYGTTQNVQQNSVSGNQGKAAGNTTSNASIGNIRLDENIMDVKKKLGTPNKKSVKEDGAIRWEYATMDVASLNDRVIGIAVDDRNISTPRGIHAGSTLQEVLNVYGHDYMLSPYGDVDCYEYAYKDVNGRTYYLRFAVKQNNGLVKYISIRYVD